MLTQSYYNLANMIHLAGPDLEANDLSPRFTPGGFGFFADAHGPRFMQYIKSAETSTTLALGDWVCRAADVTISSITSGTTVSVTKTAAGLTASAHIGKELIDETEAVAGGAPEGESGIIVANTTTVVTIDSLYPFSTAPSATANMRIRSVFHGIQNTSATTKSRNMLGSVVAAGGITAGYYGWVQFGGVHPNCGTKASAAIVLGVAVIGTTTAGKCGTSSSSAVDLLLGRALCTVASTNSGLNPVDIDCNVFGTLASA
jgi:hypothetical protein